MGAVRRRYRHLRGGSRRGGGVSYGGADAGVARRRQEGVWDFSLPGCRLPWRRLDAARFCRASVCRRRRNLRKRGISLSGYEASPHLSWRSGAVRPRRCGTCIPWRQHTAHGIWRWGLAVTARSGERAQRCDRDKRRAYGRLCSIGIPFLERPGVEAGAGTGTYSSSDDGGSVICSVTWFFDRIDGIWSCECMGIW